ncbi:flagellar biosynthesis protein FlhF [Bacillus luti]|nr:flagellar biosynthesis regulator FlhF [Bacillus cereus]
MNETVTLRGSRLEDLMRDIKEMYGEGYRVIERSEKVMMPFFWKKEFALKIQPTSKLKANASVNTVLGLLEEDNLKRQGMQNVDELKQQKNEHELKKEIEVLTKKLREKDEETHEKLLNVQNAHQQELSTQMEQMMQQIVHTVQVRPNEPFMEPQEWLLRQRYEKLISRGMKEEYARKLIQHTQMQLEKDEWANQDVVNSTLLSVLDEEMKVTGELNFDETKVIALVGSTGVGKTTTIAKIAGMLRKQNKTVGFITTDTFRIGATEQLKKFADILNSVMYTAENVEEMEEALYELKFKHKVDHILIDTVGRNPLENGLIEEIKTYIEAASPDHIALVLSSTMTNENMEYTVNSFDRINLSSLLFTKLDETVSNGLLFNAVMGSKHRISYVTNGQDVPNDIEKASGVELARALLKGGVSNEA